MQRNEYLFKEVAICTNFWAIYSKILCNMPLNAVHFGAKRSAFWCKTQGEMVQNAVQNAAKRKPKSINIHCKCINKAFKNHEIHGKKG